MPKAIDMTGQKINHLTFLERDSSKGSGYWKCQCDCNNIVTIRKDQVTRKKYPKQDCGCGLKERLSANLKDETGKKYGKLTVLHRIEDLRPGAARWLCKCECGNKCEVSGTNLRNGNVKSCGCLRIEKGRENGINEIGNQYGKLTVLYRSLNKTDGTHIFWHCKCECGNECDVNGTYLRAGTSTNCGCERSVGELKINNILKENNINFKREYTFPDLLGRGGGRLRFDFGVLNQNNELQYLIEFDGIQHFQPKCFGKNEQEFNILQEYDNLKNDYCKKNNIILIRIPYTKLKNLKFKDLVPKEANL